MIRRWTRMSTAITSDCTWPTSARRRWLAGSSLWPRHALSDLLTALVLVADVMFQRSIDLMSFSNSCCETCLKQSAFWMRSEDKLNWITCYVYSRSDAKIRCVPVRKQYPLPECIWIGIYPVFETGQFSNLHLRLLLLYWTILCFVLKICSTLFMRDVHRYLYSGGLRRFQFFRGWNLTTPPIYEFVIHETSLSEKYTTMRGHPRRGHCGHTSTWKCLLIEIGDSPLTASLRCTYIDSRKICYVRQCWEQVGAMF